MRVCFGYGSLVNTRTHSYRVTAWDTLHGWERQWSHFYDTKERTGVSLSIEPKAGSTTEGLVLSLDPMHWTELDRRERGYDRVQVRLKDEEPMSRTAVTYQSNSIRSAGKVHKIALSYLDCVLQGFHDHKGGAGVEQFLATTTGWDAPIADDRGNPIYPRAQQINRDMLKFFDQKIAEFT